MAFTQSDLDAINATIARGEKRVAYADRAVEYRSLDEMLQARAVIAAELAVGTDPATARPRQYRAYASKGLGT